MGTLVCCNTDIETVEKGPEGYYIAEAVCTFSAFRSEHGLTGGDDQESTTILQYVTCNNL